FSLFVRGHAGLLSFPTRRSSDLAFTVHNALLDVSFMLVFGIIGYAFKKLDYPMAPLVLALVLGDMAESNFRNSMILSDGDLSILDRKSTRLNSSHVKISYAVFCL